MNDTKNIILKRIKNEFEKAQKEWDKAKKSKNITSVGSLLPLTPKK